MAGVVAGNVFYNTESGLTPTLDRLTAMLDKDSTARQQLAGIAPALAATGIPVSQQSGIFGGVLGALGIGGQQQPTIAQPQQAAPATPMQAGAPQTSAYRGPAPGFDDAVMRTLGFEGGMNPKDTNGTPSNFGINQKSNPGVDVASLTPDAAKGIYKSNYWDAIGADSLPPALSRAAFDTAVIAGPGKAKELLAASGGDPVKFMDLRQQFQNDLVQSDPQKYGSYAKAWSSRNNGLRLDIAALSAGAGGGMPAAASAYAPQGGGPTPGTSAAGADVAVAGLAARSAAGYGSPPTGISTGAQAAAATGAAPMPIATSEPHVTPTMQTGIAPGASPAPALGAASGITRAPLGGITNDALGAMISNPASRDLGLKLWQQKLTGKDFGFQVTPDGAVVRLDKETGQAIPVYQAPVKQGFQELNGRLVATDPLSGTARDATPAGLPQGYRFASPQERQGYVVPDGQPLFIGPDGKPGTLNGGNTTVINNAIEPLQKAAGERFDRSLTAADAAAKSIPAIRTARQQLDGGIFSGALAGEKLGLQKLAESLGLPGVDPAKIVNTETFRAAVGPVVLQTVKGLGAGAGISNADRDFAERMAGGNIQLDGNSIRRILDIQERAAQATINQHNTLVDQIMQSPAGAAAYKNIGPAMRVAAPPAAASGGSKTIGGQTYTKGPDGRWYAGP